MNGREGREIVTILWFFKELDAEGLEVRLVDGKLVVCLSIASSSLSVGALL